jgi:hypothetical protein
VFLDSLTLSAEVEGENMDATLATERIKSILLMRDSLPPQDSDDQVVVEGDVEEDVEEGVEGDVGVSLELAEKTALINQLLSKLKEEPNII